MVEVDIKALLAAGAHFGHKTSRWHPRMAPYIHSKRGGSHIIDLAKTVELLEPALTFIIQTVARGKQVLLVGTKRQVKEIVAKAAESVSMPYVTERWLGGMLTNHKTVFARVKHLKDLESKLESGELTARYNKLEVQRFQEEIASLNIVFGGIKNLNGLPGAVVVLDAVTDDIAVREANRLSIPVVGLVDTNADPTRITYPVPCNDDAVKALQLMADYFVAAITEGKSKQKVVGETESEAVPKRTPQPKTEPTDDSSQSVESEPKSTTKKPVAAEAVTAESEPKNGR